MNISIQTLIEEHFEVANTILQAAYATPDSRLEDLRRITTMQPDGWFIASLEGRKVGMVGAMDYGRFAYIGMMAVHPAVQRKGVGTKMLEHLLDWLDKRGCPILLLDATQYGEPLYRKIGFVEVDQALQYVLLGRPQSGFPATRSLMMNAGMFHKTFYGPPKSRVSRMQPEDLPAIQDYDLTIFGADRSRVLQCYLADYPERGFIVRDKRGSLAGYLLAQPRKLGPWVARSPADAEALLQAALTLPFKEGSPFAIVPAANRQAAKLFKHYGFKQLSGLPHMQRGGKAHPCQREFMYGQTSFAIG